MVKRKRHGESVVNSSTLIFVTPLIYFTCIFYQKKSQRKAKKTKNTNKTKKIKNDKKDKKENKEK